MTRLTNHNETLSTYFVGLMWGIDLLYYIKAVVLRIPLLNLLAGYFIPFVVVLSIIICFKAINARFKPSDYFFFFASILIFVLHIGFFPKNEQYLLNTFNIFCFNCLPYFFVGLVCDPNRHIEMMEKVSVAYVILGVVYMLYFSSRVEYSENMGRAYAYLPHCLLLLFSILKKFKLIHFICFLLSFLIILGSGNRGTLIVLLFYISGYLLVGTSKQGFLVKILLGLSVVLILVFFSQLSMQLMYLISSLGMSTRALDFMDEGIFLSNSNGRDIIRSILIQKLFEAGPFGYGLCGDRFLLNGMFSHNIFIEFLISFGVVFGTILFLWLIITIIKGYKGSVSVNEKGIWLLFVGLGFVSLFISNSFLGNQYFYLMLGYCIGVYRNNRQNSNGIISNTVQ